MKLPLNRIQSLQKELTNHQLLNTNIIKDIKGIHIFMEHHVFAVWDFMSLIKSLQHYICPSTTCWTPNQKKRSKSARLVNQIILSEETDIDLDGINSISHYDLYCQAMSEIGADTNVIEKWVNNVIANGYNSASKNSLIPKASLEFMQQTFDIIDSDKPHMIAAAFCFGRETIIPQMFISLADQLNLTKIDCPKFHYYLDRHIQLDGEEHGPASIVLIEDLCDDITEIHEAEEAALKAIQARIKFWDDITNKIHIAG